MGGGAILAHGGAVGAAFEIGFILVPVVIFAVLARWSKRKQQEEEAEEAEGADEGASPEAAESPEGATAEQDDRA